MWKTIFKKTASEPEYVVATLKAKLMPLDRGRWFEDPLDVVLKEDGSGEVSGGGTMCMPSGEPEFADIEIQVKVPVSQVVDRIIASLEHSGAPKGSELRIEKTGESIRFGTLEGLAVYFNGTDLPDHVYADCDIDFAWSEFDRLLDGEGKVYSFWQGQTETALYLYGTSYNGMLSKIEAFLSSYPLCEKARLVQFA
jgi:hypothetical protein